MENIVYIAEIIVGIGLLIFVHELGHFLAAKWAGVRVNKFALGFGPKLLWKQKGETEYSLRLIPLGGFVAMAGEEPGSEASPQPEREFRNQPVGRRMVIILSGVVMNYVTAVVIFTVVWATGLTRTLPIVGPVAPNSAAEQAGLHPGDRILAVDGDPIIDFEDLTLAVAESGADEKLRLTIERDGSEITLQVEPRTDKELGMPAIGIRPALGREIMDVRKDSPAQKAGLEKGDVIRSVDGLVFYTDGDFENWMNRHIGKPVRFEVARGGNDDAVTRTFTLTPEVMKVGTLGITPKGHPRVGEISENSPAAEAGFQKDDLIVAVNGETGHTAADIIRMISNHPDGEVTVKIRRDGEEKELKMTPRVFPGEHRARIGLEFRGASDFTVGEVAEGSAAAKAGIQPDDVLVAIDDTSLVDNPKRTQKPTWGMVRAILTEKIGEEVKVEYRSGKALFTRTLTVAEFKDPHIADTGLVIPTTMTVVRRYSPAKAPVVALKHSWIALKQVYIAVRGIATRRIVASKAVGGPVGIAGLSYRAAQAGLNQFLYLLALIGVNLAAVNLLPLLPLDGGLLFFLIIEKFRGRPVTERWQLRLQIAGWVLLLSLFVVITFNDITRIISS